MKNIIDRERAEKSQKKLSFILYFLGWCLAIFLAFRGDTLLAAIVPIVMTILFLSAIFYVDSLLFLENITYALLNLCLGSFLEFLLIRLNAISYQIADETFCPLWVLSLYPLFGLFLHHQLGFFKTRKLAGFFLGALGGCYLYYGCEKLSLVHVIDYPRAGLLWGLYFALALFVSFDVERARKKTLHDKNKKALFTLLFDDSCKVCSYEISLLRKKSQTSLQYVDISSPSYDPRNCRGISKEEAMKVIHGYFEGEKTDTGPQVLSSLYAKTGHENLSFLLNLGLIRIFADPLYRLFARYRHFFKKNKNQLD